MNHDMGVTGRLRLVVIRMTTRTTKQNIVAVDHFFPKRNYINTCFFFPKCSIMTIIMYMGHEMSPLNITQPLGIWSIMATIR